MEYTCKSTTTSSKLRHRFVRLLLGSSCSTTIAAGTVVRQTKPPPTTPTTHPAADIDLDFDSRNRSKLDLHSPFSSVASTDRRLRRVAPLVHVSIDCGARRSVDVSEREALLPLIPKAAAPPPEQRKFYGATKPSKKVSCEMKKKKTARIAEAKKPLSSNAYGFTSSSSFDSEKNELGLFSSDDEDEEDEEEEEERAALFSSKSFSSDSSEFYHRSRRNKNKPKQRSKSMKSTRRPQPPPPPRRRPVREHSCGAIDQLRPLVSISNPRPPGPNKEKPPPQQQPAAGFAVVTRSSDPYGDFRSSMVDMIVGRGLSRGRDLERLLHSYLTLNSPCHHSVILEAFGDICESIFSK